MLLWLANLDGIDSLHDADAVCGVSLAVVTAMDLLTCATSIESGLCNQLRSAFLRL